MVVLHDPNFRAERRLVQPGRQPRSEVNDALLFRREAGRILGLGSDAVKEVAKCLDYCKAAL